VGREVVYRPVDAAELTASLIAAGADEGAASFAAALDANIGGGALGEVTSDLSRLIGRPTTTLVDGLRPLA